MARRTKREAQETRGRILDAAERVFHERGVTRASLEDIAASAKVTRGAIYWHFKDKADLFDALMQRVVLPAEAVLERAGKDGVVDPLELLRRASVEVLMRTARDKRVARIFDIAYHKCEQVGDTAGIRERHVASQQECRKSVEAGLRDCIAQGLLPKSVDPREAAIGIVSLVSGLIATWVLDPKSFSLARHAESLTDTYFRGLASKRSAPRKEKARQRVDPPGEPRAEAEPAQGGGLSSNRRRMLPRPPHLRR